jgi:hypothetical protein
VVCRESIAGSLVREPGWRDSGRSIPEGNEARRKIAELEQKLRELKGE